MSAGSVLGPFLQDIIGRDEVLTPSSGRLRTIHARIVKEVEDAKQELHSTVQQQWPTLKRQYNTTIDISDRLKAITGEVQSLEGDLDGDESALRPRLQTSFAAHTQLAKRHKDSDALVDLLQSLKNLQRCIAVVEELLADGKLDEVVPALQGCERLIHAEIEDWKKDCEPYKTMKTQYEHSRNITKECLEEALNRCVSFKDGQLILASYTSGSQTSKSHTLGLQSIIKSLATLMPAEKHFQRIADTLLRTFVKPVLVDSSLSAHLQAPDEHTQILSLQPSASGSLRPCTDSLRTILRAIRSSIASDETSPEHRQLFLTLIVPQIQQLLIENVLSRSLPTTADQNALVAFQETCKTIANFEAEELLPSGGIFEAIVQDWVRNAGEHWSNGIIQRCFATLRADVTTSQYWNKTEMVDWLDDPQDEEDKKNWERWLSASNSAPVSSPQQQPQASTSKLPGFDRQSDSTRTRAPVVNADEIEEEVAWEFDEDEVHQENEPVAPQPASDLKSSMPVEGIEDSPDLNADDAWGFDEDQMLHDDTAESTTTGSAGRTNGHKKNSLSKSSTRSRSSQKSPQSAKGKGVQQKSAIGNELDEDDDGGWSFDADAEMDIEDQPAQKAPNLPESEPVVASAGNAAEPLASGHSRHSSIDDAWGWSRNPDPEEQKPIGKPTKVIVSKRLGAKGRTGSSAAPSPALDSDVESSTSRTATPIPTPSTAGIQVKNAEDEREETKVTVPWIEEPQQKQTKQMTQLFISSNAKRVGEISLELLEAALAVSSAPYSTVDIASSSRRLLKAASDTYDLYRAIVPVAHSALISTVPSIGMQLSNDCLYAAHEGTRINTDTVDSTKLGQDDKMAQWKPVNALRTFAHHILDEQIELQRVPLMETLDETDGFRSTDDPGTFARCQRCVRQLVHTITSISHAWKPVLLKRVYFESLGILVNAILLRVLVEIENQEDISEESSHRLNDLCKMLHELESLFQDGEESTVALHVPVWFKFKFLSELLEASMADIMYLFNEGHLVDFSATELSKLVRALFADSQLRQRNLETIARGRANPSA